MVWFVTEHSSAIFVCLLVCFHNRWMNTPGYIDNYFYRHLCESFLRTSTKSLLKLLKLTILDSIQTPVHEKKHKTNLTVKTRHRSTTSSSVKTISPSTWRSWHQPWSWRGWLISAHGWGWGTTAAKTATYNYRPNLTKTYKIKTQYQTSTFEYRSKSKTRTLWCG